MKHVAKAAGVSVMTVSLALRHDPTIPAATRERVLGIAAQVGYRRNPLVSVLMAGLRGRRPRNRDTDVIAYVESYPAGKLTTQKIESLARFRAGAAQGAARHNYRLQTFQLGEAGMSEARLEQMLSARGIRGVIFAPFPKVGSVLLQAWKDHALAKIGYSLVHPQLHRAVNHQVHSIRLAIAQLLALGYRRVGVVVSRHADARVERNWLTSVLLAQHENADSDLKFPLFLEERIERQPLVAWLRENKPEVVLTTGDFTRTTFLRLGGRDAKGIGFAHLHLTPTLGACSGIDQNNERVSAAAVDLVVEQLHTNHFGIPENPKTVLLEGRWVPGTTAPGPNCVNASK